eukprot:s3649_g2.t1
MASSSFLDSEATFVQQAEDGGLSRPWIDALKLNQMATFAKLSFAITTPGTVATDEQINRFLNTIRVGVAPTIAELGAFKRLLFESQTLMMHSFKTTARGEDSGPKKMAQPEREARLERQREQLRGLDISGPLGPAHSLYDICANMVEKNEIAYINPNKCLSRQQELMGVKPEKEIQLDATKSALVVREQASHAEISINSDLALYQALQRRTLALDLTGIASYEVMRKWIDRLFAMYAQSPAPGFQRVTQAQLLRADRQAFIRMSELFSGSLKTHFGAGKPLDPYVERLETDVSVTYFMLPVPTAHSSASAGSSGDKTDKTDKKRPDTSTKPTQQFNKYQKGGAKGGQKGGKGKKRDPIPQALKGMHSRNLTYAMKHFFPDSFGVDHKVTKQRVKIVCLDLTKSDHQLLVEQWLTSGKCLWVHFGIPCGTASRARLRRLSKKIHGPPPLRNSRWPDGIPGVKGVHLLKLRAANRLYSFMRHLIKKLHKLGITWTVENPLTSLLWETSYWVEIDELTHPFYCELHNCMFGGTRLKRTCLASNNSAVMALNVLCDGQHEHAPWSMTNGVFDTSLEAEYTPTLARAIATTISEAICKEYKLANVVQVSKKLKLSHFHSIAAAKQPTKALPMQTVPEFAYIVVFTNLPGVHSFDLNGPDLQQCVSIFMPHHEFLLPCSSKMLRRTTKKGGDSRPFKFSVDKTPALQALTDLDWVHSRDDGVEREECLVCHNAEKPCQCVHMHVTTESSLDECADWVFGIRWTPELFVQQAVMAGHPFSSFSGLQAEVRAACECIASQPRVDVINNRCSKLGEWLRLAKALKPEEEKLKEAMPEERRRILSSKRILLMRHIIDAEGYDDKELSADLEQGFSLVGEVPTSNVLPRKILPASITTTDLVQQSQRSNTALRYMTRSCGDPSLDVKLWEKTMLEVERGWLVGPLDWSELTTSSTVSRRFPLEQSGKVRPIDDLSQSQINATVTSYEQATVDGPDVICAFAVYLMKCLERQERPTALVGRSLDLASAYRQLAVSDDSSCHAFL